MLCAFSLTDFANTTTLNEYNPSAIMFFETHLQKVHVIVSASTSLLVKELFQSRVNRTGSLAPSQRQQCSRKPSTKASHKVVTTKVAFDYFKKSPEQKVSENEFEFMKTSFNPCNIARSSDLPFQRGELLYTSESDV